MKPLRLSQEAVHLNHLVQRIFRPTLLLEDAFSLIAQGLYELWAGHQVEYRVRESLGKRESRVDWRMSPECKHTIEVVWMAAKFVERTRSTRFRTARSSPTASSKSQEIKSFWRITMSGLFVP
jgi:hypothetical protein